MADRADTFVEGVPIKKKKATGNQEVAAKWKAAVNVQTANLGRMAGPCLLDIEFVLHPASFSDDHPYGTDLDNLLKSTMDALGETVLSEVKGKDAAIIELRARKRQARNGEPTGARITFTAQHIGDS